MSLSAQTSYHLLLWRPWIHKHKLFRPRIINASSYLERQESPIYTSEYPVQRDEPQLLEVTFFDELIEDGELVPA